MLRRGVRQGDVIVSWDGQPLAGVDALMRMLGPDSVGRTVVFGLRRAGEAMDPADHDRGKAAGLIDTTATLVVALRLDDPVLGDRVAALLSGVPGLRLAEPGEASDIAIIGSDMRDSIDPDAEPALTPREVEVLALLAEGASNKAIARRLGISVHTAKFHVGQVLDKFDATGRTDAVAHAARRGVLHL